MGRDLKNLSLINDYHGMIKKDEKTVQNAVRTYGYTLKYLTKKYDAELNADESIDTKSLSDAAGSTQADIKDIKEQQRSQSDYAAYKLISQLVASNESVPKEVKIYTHPKLMFNGINVDHLLNLYDTPNNLSDVAIMINYEQKMTNLVNIEVNSSPIEQTVSKTIHGLIQLARIVKCHEVKDVCLTGFSLPNLQKKTVAVKTEVKYDSQLMAFDVSSKPIKCENFAHELYSAISRNHKVLQDCQFKKPTQHSKELILCLSEDEMGRFGSNPVQKYAKYGILFEVTKEGKTYCCKKPKYNDTLSTLTTLALEPALLALHHQNLNFAIKYKYEYIPKVFMYEKVKFGPLPYKDAVSCLHDLLTKLKAVCESLSSLLICHNDVRVPNICFNEKFEIVLIDFDKATLNKGNCFQDLSIFAQDLIEHSKKRWNGINSLSWTSENKFLSELEECRWSQIDFEIIRNKCKVKLYDILNQ